MIELHSVEKRYGNIQALQSISFTVAEGEFFALLGPNGAGKTTIIRILLDFTRPTSGSAWVHGIPSHNADARKYIGYLPENMKLPSYLSGRSFLRQQAGLSGIDGRKAAVAVDKFIELVGMKERGGHPAGTYSKGMLQRIGLAAALIAHPRILILDEPTTGLDPVGIREFRQILERVKLDRVTVLLNSHILSEVEKLCSSAAILNKGAIVVKDEIGKLVDDTSTLEDVFVKYVGAG